MLYIVTAVHNRYTITERFVDQLNNQTYKDFQLILVDDGSTDGTAEMVRNNMPSAQILHGDGNLWWGGAMACAYSWIKDNCKGDHFVLLANDDILFDNSFFEKALAVLLTEKNIMLTGCGVSQNGQQNDGAFIIEFPSSESRLVDENKERNYGNCATTHCLFLRLTDYISVGSFHPVLLPHYGSDFEWTIRGCRKDGLRVLCINSLQYTIGETTKGYKEDYRLKNIFSKRSMQNPIYKICFIALSAPKGMKGISLILQIKRFWKYRKYLNT